MEEFVEKLEKILLDLKHCINHNCGLSESLKLLDDKDISDLKDIRNKIKIIKYKIENGVNDDVFKPYTTIFFPDDFSNEYEKFMVNYIKKHFNCPKCGSCVFEKLENISDIRFRDEMNDDYRDLSKCKCSTCENIHTFNERTELYGK